MTPGTKITVVWIPWSGTIHRGYSGTCGRNGSNFLWRRVGDRRHIYNLHMRTEGTNWIRGWPPLDSAVVRALKAACVLTIETYGFSVAL